MTACTFFAKNIQKGFIFSLFSMVGMHVAFGANAQPDAGQILNEIERDIQVRPLPKIPEIESVAPAEEDQGPKVVIKQFKFEGNKALSEVQLQDALASLTNREISVTELKTCTDLIAAFYRQQGFVATATLPDQDITEGVVVIKITEAIFGAVKIDGEYGKDYKRVRPAVIERMIAAGAMKGKVLDQSKLDQSLANVQNLAGIKIQSALQAGEQEGSTDVLVKVIDQRMFGTFLSVDNTGGRQTGREKGLANITIVSPFGFGETFTVTGLHSQGTDYGKVAINVPVNNSGLQVGLSATHMQYDVIVPEFASQGLNGYSSSFGINAKYPLLKTKDGGLAISVDAEKKLFTNKNNTSGVTGDYSLQDYSVTLSGDRADALLAGAQNTASLTLGSGYVDLAGTPGESNDQHATSGPRTKGSYSYLRWNLNRNQFINDTIALTLNGSGQFADSNLDSSEKFYLGGIDGVRAYPTSEGGGSEGYLVTAELRKYLPHDLSVSVFVDHGEVKQFADNQGADGTALSSINRYSLTGYGASLNWQGPYNTNLKATYAHRMGSNPNPASNGVNDQDGSRVIDVFWLNGSVSF